MMEYKTSIENLANAYGKQSADLKAAMKEIESLRQQVGGLTMQLDAQYGTPCEQMRNLVEEDKLKQEIQTLRSDLLSSDGQNQVLLEELKTLKERTQHSSACINRLADYVTGDRIGYGDPKDLVDAVTKEIETLREENRKLHVRMDFSRILIKEKYMKELEKEIESLRSDYENVCQDIELQNKQMMEWYADKRRAEDDRDEWKRRAEIMWRSLERIPGNALGVMYDDLPDDEPNWFEEE